jgi:hypothetical protein
VKKATTPKHSVVLESIMKLKVIFIEWSCIGQQTIGEGLQVSTGV